MKTLVTGGVRSGKSGYAESLLADEPAVTYVAPGPTPAEDGDPDWADRIARHQARRPAHWTTLESRELGSALTESEGALLIDCLGTWLAAVLDEAKAWNANRDDVEAVVRKQLDPLLEALAATPSTVVLVTNEVGLGVVPAHRSGRLFRDFLGTINQEVGALCDRVDLVMAGKVLHLGTSAVPRGAQ